MESPKRCPGEAQMEVIDTQAAWLSNYEVFEHLKTQKAQRASSRQGRPIQAAENVQTIEFEVHSWEIHTSRRINVGFGIF